MLFLTKYPLIIYLHLYKFDLTFLHFNQSYSILSKKLPSIEELMKDIAKIDRVVIAKKNNRVWDELLDIFSKIQDYNIDDSEVWNFSLAFLIISIHNSETFQSLH